MASPAFDAVEPDLVPVRPLIGQVSFLDIILPPLLVYIALLLSPSPTPRPDDRPHPDSDPSPSPPTSRGGAHIYASRTRHARFIPSKNAFAYPTLYLGFDIDRLSDGEFDIPYWFAWGRSAVTSLSPSSYLDPSSSHLPFRRRVLDELARHGFEEAKDLVGRIYVLTMPSYLGFIGINPLTTYFCYAAGDEGRLEAVILEVHNTFGERHLYVLRVGVEEDERVQRG